MKALVVLLAILFGVWLWRRGQTQRRVQRTVRRPLPPQAMAACDQCGVHVPESTLIPGRAGRYCSAEHRREAEGG